MRAELRRLEQERGGRREGPDAVVAAAEAEVRSLRGEAARLKQDVLRAEIFVALIATRNELTVLVDDEEGRNPIAP